MTIELFITDWNQEKGDFYEIHLGTVAVSQGGVSLEAHENTYSHPQRLFDMAKPKLPLYRISTRLWAKRFAHNFQHINTYAVISS